MNQDWQNFLATQGAQIQDGVVNNFGDVAAEQLATRDNTVLCDLSQFGTLRVSGEEAEAFLQSMLSNDISEVSKTRAQLSSLNTAKGRMLTTLLIWREENDYLMQLPRELCIAISKKLSMYVLRAKVKITDVSEEIISLGLSGEHAQGILHTQLGELPQLPLDVSHADFGSVIKINGLRWQINTTLRQAPALWMKLSEKAWSVSSGCWDWLNIRSGIPFILPNTQEQFVAQMVNFDLIKGVNFKKGCYPGQEIVARTQYLGKLKRRMYLAHIAADEKPRAGDELFSADMEGQATGMLVNVANAPTGGYDVLAVVQITSHATHSVHLGKLQGTQLAFDILPYPLT